MRYAAAEICNPLTKIINASLETGHVPSEWKVTRVVPLFKSGKITDLDNYRPISILPVASKILERAVPYSIVQLFNNVSLFKSLPMWLSEKPFDRDGGYSLYQHYSPKYGPRSFDWVCLYRPSQCI